MVVRSASSSTVADRLLIADADAGLLTMSTTTGVVERLVTEVDGHRMVFCNNAAVASNGDIWFSDSSTVYPIAKWKADFVENTRTGRLLCRRADGTVEVHLDGLAFANGVALADRRVVRLRRRDGPPDRRTTVADG